MRDVGVLRHYPTLALALVAAGLVVGLTATLGPLFRGAAEEATLATELGDHSPLSLGARVTTRAGQGAEDLAGVVDELRQDLSGHDAFSTATVTLMSLNAVDVAAGTTEPNEAGRVLGAQRVRVVARQGFADHIEVVDGDPGAEGIWLPDALADQLGVGAGDEIRMGRRPLSAREGEEGARVAGVHRDLRLPLGDPIAPFWSPLSGLFYYFPNDPTTPPPDPVVLVDDATAAEVFSRTLSTAVGVPLIGQAGITVELPLEPSATADLDAAKAAAADIEALRADLVDLDGSFAAALARIEAPPPQVSSGVGGVVRRVDATITALGAPVALLTGFGLLVGLVVVAVTAMFTGATRRAEVGVRLAQGLGPNDQARSAIVESVLWLGLGGALGAAASWAGVGVFGPSGWPPPSSFALAAATGMAGIVASLGIVAAATVVQVRGLVTAARPRRGRLRRVPWELVPASLTVAAGYQVLTRGDVLVLGDEGAVRIDALILVFPMLVVITAVAVGIRLLRPALALGQRVPATGRPALLLVSRRLAAASIAALGLVGAAGLAAGLGVYATTVVASTVSTIEAKRVVATGAETVAVAFTTLDHQGVDIGAPLTTVRRFEARDTTGQPVEIVGIDPATFGEVVALDARWLGSDPAELLAALAGTAGERLPVAVVGSDRIDSVDLGVGGTPDLRIVARPPIFAGQGQVPMIVVDWDALSGAAGERAQLDLRARHELWADSSSADVVSALSGFGPGEPVRADDVVARSGLQAYTWTLNLLQVLSALGILLAAIGVVLFLRARQRQRSVAYALIKRMGLRAQSHRVALIAEIAVLLVAATVIGTVAALGAAMVTLARTDPLPSLAPGPLFEVPMALLPALALLTLAVAIIAGSWAHRQTERAPAAEVLRLAE